MNFYKILKIKKLGRGSPDFWSRLFAKHTGGSAKPVINVLTGRLPLFFSTSESKLRDWTIYGNNQPGKNLFDKNAPRINGYYLNVEGYEVRGSTWGISEYIDVEGGNNYTAQGLSGGGASACWYDANYEFLGGESYGGEAAKTFSLPAEAKYIRLTIRILEPSNINALMISKGSTVVDYEPYQIGVGEKTKNLLKITGEDELVTRGITFTHDKNNHTIRVNGQATGNAFYACGDVTLKAGTQYILNGCPAGGSVSGTYTYQLYIADYSNWGFDTGNGLTLPIMTEDTVITTRIGVYAGAGELIDLIFEPMVREANTTSEFIPYGYQIPLDIRDGMTGEYNYAYNIFIGESPLIEGESISKSSTDIDIRTIADRENYPNILTTALMNKPEMTIKYK